MSDADSGVGGAQRIAERVVPEGSLVAWWLGGSGFAFKTPAGTQIYVDPYLSDAARAIFGLARAFPAPIADEDARPDVVICTHWHEDHLDPEAIPIIARHSAATRFVMPPSAMARALSWGVARERIAPLAVGESLTIRDVTISHVPARHEPGIAGWEVPDAMGVILEAAGLQIYHTGDTEYDLRLRAMAGRGIDAISACINGTGGNMDAHEAALLAWRLGARLAVPMHHRLWAENPEGVTVDPRLFAGTYRALGGRGRVVVPELLSEIVIGPERDLRPSGATGEGG